MKLAATQRPKGAGRGEKDAGSRRDERAGGSWAGRARADDGVHHRVRRDGADDGRGGDRHLEGVPRGRRSTRQPMARCLPRPTGWRRSTRRSSGRQRDDRSGGGAAADRGVPGLGRCDNRFSGLDWSADVTGTTVTVGLVRRSTCRSFRRAGRAAPTSARTRRPKYRFAETPAGRGGPECGMGEARWGACRSICQGDGRWFRDLARGSGRLSRPSWRGPARPWW